MLKLLYFTVIAVGLFFWIMFFWYVGTFWIKKHLDFKSRLKLIAILNNSLDLNGEVIIDYISLEIKKQKLIVFQDAIIVMHSLTLYLESEHGEIKKVLKNMIRIFEDRNAILHQSNDNNGSDLFPKQSWFEKLFMN